MPRPAPTPARRPLLLLVPILVAVTACGSTSGDEESAERTGSRTAEAPAAGAPPAEAPPAEEAPAPPPSSPLPGTAWVVFGADTVVAEVARTADERARGLMYREEVPDGTGMLFVWESEAVRSFWMENTYVPLDIAFLDRNLRVVGIQRMEPGSTERHESPVPILFALEVRGGWFAEHGIAVGDRAEIVFGG